MLSVAVFFSTFKGRILQKNLPLPGFFRLDKGRFFSAKVEKFGHFRKNLSKPSKKQRKMLREH